VKSKREGRKEGRNSRKERRYENVQYQSTYSVHNRFSKVPISRKVEQVKQVKYLNTCSYLIIHAKEPDQLTSFNRWWRRGKDEKTARMLEEYHQSINLAPRPLAPPSSINPTTEDRR
jgi:hypothetical protein